MIEIDPRRVRAILHENNLDLELSDEYFDATKFTEEFTRRFSERIDLVTPNPNIDRALARAFLIFPSAIAEMPIQSRTRLKRLDSEFSKMLFFGLQETTKDKTQITGGDILTSYVDTVFNGPYESISHVMLKSTTMNNLFDHFGVPIHPTVIDQAQQKDPELASRYTRRTNLWKSGQSPSPSRVYF